jgi:hypothetical protein
MAPCEIEPKPVRKARAAMAKGAPGPEKKVNLVQVAAGLSAEFLDDGFRHLYCFRMTHDEQIGSGQE